MRAWHVCVCACVCASVQGPVVGLCFRTHLKAQQFRRLKLLNMSFTTLPTMQCKVVDYIYINAEVKMRGKQLVWMFPHVFFCFISSPSEFKSLLSQKGKWNGTLFRCWKALLWHIVITASGSTQLYLSVSAQEKRNCSRNRFHHRVKRTVQEGREGTVREYRWKSPRKICNVYNVIIYDAARWQPISCEFLMKDWLWGGIHQELWVYKNHSNGYYIYVLFIVLLIGFIFNFFYCYYIILENKYIVIS